MDVIPERFAQSAERVGTYALGRACPASGSNPDAPNISSVHNGFELWTLDFFVISSFFVMYGAGFKPALLFYADLVIYSTATPFRVFAL